MTIRNDICGVPFDTHSIPEFLAEVRYLLEHPDATSRALLCVNAHIHTLARRDDELRSTLSEARVVAVDGMGVVLAARLMGAAVFERCNMTEAFRAFLARDDMPPSRCLLVGCKSQDVEKAARQINAFSRHCVVVETHSGYLDDSEYERIFRDRTDVNCVLIGMGTPKTERITHLAARILPHVVVWGIGAGTIRIFAGVMQEASPMMRKMGLQWLHRLCSEPANLWRRYILGNPVFIGAVLLDVVSNRKRNVVGGVRGD